MCAGIIAGNRPVTYANGVWGEFVQAKMVSK
jgi:hypothetical protein